MRSFRDRNRIIFGARRGYIRLALRENVPIVPVVTAGAHETVLKHEEWEEAIEGYLAWKWGLQASLPGGHTYANAAPVIPEPTSLALLGLGGLMIARRRRV